MHKMIYWLCVLICMVSAQDGVSMNRPPAAALSESVGVKTIEYFDSDRDRPVTVELWYPVESGFPSENLANDLYIHPKESRNVPLAEALQK